jgi:hypothetical protein
MDQENKQQNADTATTNTATPHTSNSTKQDSPTMDQLMAQSPKLSPFCGWIKCLRSPALSMQYSIQKRHVPDLNADTAQQTSGTSSAAGQNSDTMDVTGGFTIRYFDFALGVLGLMMAGCLLKGCCFLKKKMF